MSRSRPWAAGHYSALVGTLTLPAEAAAGMIPAGLELGEQNLTPEGTHPALMMFGHHTRVHPSFLKIRGWSYHEFLVAIPWIRRTGDSMMSSTMPRLYLDNLPMVLAGWIYSFPKVWTRIRAAEESYEVRGLLSGNRIIEAEWALEGEPGPVSRFPSFEGVAPTFAQPFIQRFPPLPFEVSKMVFDLESAVIQPAAASVIITRPFLRGLPTGPQSFPSLAQTPLGSFTISVPWTLGPP